MVFLCSSNPDVKSMNERHGQCYTGGLDEGMFVVLTKLQILEVAKRLVCLVAFIGQTEVVQLCFRMRS